MIFGAFCAGVYVGYLIWAPYTGKAFLTVRREECGGHGMRDFGFGNVGDCPACHGGRNDKRGAIAFFFKHTFKWVGQ